MPPKPSFEVKLDADELMKLEKMLARVPGGMERAVKGGINKTLRKLRTRITRTINAKSGIKQKAIRDNIILRRASRHLLRGLVVFGDDRVPLIDLNARQTKKGVTFESEGGQRDLVPHAFIETLGSGHKGVFKRKGKEGQLVPRLPIQELFGPSITSLFDKAYQVRRRVLEESEEFLNHYILQEANRLIRRYS